MANRCAISGGSLQDCYLCGRHNRTKRGVVRVDDGAASERAKRGSMIPS